MIFIPLCFFLAISFYNCYTDIRYRKIKNSFLLLGFFTGVVFYLASVPSLHAWQTFLINVILSIFVAGFFWRMNIWAAGDGKFFIFTAMYVALFVSHGYIPRIHPPLPVIAVVLINSFILTCCYLFLRALGVFLSGVFRFFSRQENAREIGGEFIKKIKDRDFIFLQLKTVFFYVGAFVLFSIIRHCVSSWFRLPRQSDIILYVGLIFAYSFIRKILRKVKTGYVLFVVGLLFLYSRPDIIPLLKGAGKFFLVLGTIRFAINCYLRQAQTKCIHPDALIPTMLLAPEEIRKMSCDDKPDRRFFSDGLTRSQAEHIKRYCQRENREEIKIYNTLPFVPFIFLGTVVTFILRGRVLDLVSFLYR